jgi:hypothetical protein
MMRTTATAMVLGLGLTLSSIGSAQAAPGGNRAPVEASGTFDVHDLCLFPVHIEAHVVGASTTAPQPGGGSIVRTHLVEDDVYSANGNSVGGTYTFNIQVTLDADGNVIAGYQTGTIVRVPLPDGTVFQVEGRVDSLNAQTDYIFAPTHGVTKNRDALCAYLGS